MIDDIQKNLNEQLDVLSRRLSVGSQRLAMDRRTARNAQARVDTLETEVAELQEQMIAIQGALSVLDQVANAQTDGVANATEVRDMPSGIGKISEEDIHGKAKANGAK